MKSNLLNRKCIEHQNKQILLSCFNKYCKEKRLICQNCLLLHTAHAQDFINDEQIEDKVKQSQSECKQFIKQLNDMFDELTLLFKKLISSIETKFYISIEKMNRIENEQLNQYLNQLIIYDQQQLNLTQIFTDGCQYLQDKIILCQNDLGLKDLNYIEITKEEMEKAEVYYNQGCDYYDKDDYGNAIKLFDLALDLNRQHLKSLHYKGASLMMLGQYKESIEWYDKALQIDSKYTFALGGKGESLRMLGQYKESIEWYDKALQIDSKYKLALYGKGDSLRNLLQYNQALECLDTALQIDSNFANALGSKGACLIQLGRFDEAEICLNKAIKLDPNSTFKKNQLKILQDKRKQ